MIKVEKFVVNPLGENSFILSDETGECIFIDPGFYYDEEYQEIKDYVHFDHIMGVEFVRNEFKIPFYAHAADVFWVEKAVTQGQMFGFEMNPVAPVDAFLSENDFIEFGNSRLQIIHVPGHSPGHVVFYSEKDKILIAGDVLFYGSIGRTDLPGGNYDTLISGIKNKLFVLPDDTTVFCGHGPETKLGFEKRTNPFLT